ncbi:16S rRNA (cytidine(1402)-2'-O)-methyltransferase [Bartonella sp. TP]|uniref:16S rRNA (cytidine(1402)-2'-O)-methyltransferase n=1 Tax=Bartonella sp. TP TaxID=3057550 RepID=UPI0025B26A77|nr:16S rRNA (cytidine(1402)-2'-O)-methyltransferase [Bartonella sp. TP]MDN5249112.1 16S rRNA (cytidine(1402)-2'-O)-methyltransferase [Alphaproteobacteria bacterium]WJW79681.1 16S rRNA (cytidine(1402)-2'-O)-methyltransferase [Bartonella sp. TP]
MVRSYTIGSHIYEAKPLEPALYIVSTPIGNLSDITLRALETLAAVDIIACEDARVSLKLLNHYGIKAKMVSYHEHSPAQIGIKLIAEIANGRSVAIISDAGTPIISDPGFELVQYATQTKIKTVPIPGACAAIAALSASGLPTNQFYFVGFLPARHVARRKMLSELVDISATLVFYESPHRLIKTLADMVEVFGSDREAAICRELTKKFETYKADNLARLYEYYFANVTKLGEIVILVEPGASIAKSYDKTELKHLLKTHMQNMPAAKAAAFVAKITGLPKQQLYRMILEF